jgi:hypothetical protein
MVNHDHATIVALWSLSEYSAWPRALSARTAPLGITGREPISFGQ